MPSRVYVVVDLENPAKQPRLVDATYEHTALRHVSTGRYQARIASKQDLVRYMQSGVQVEYADPQRSETQQPLDIAA